MNLRILKKLSKRAAPLLKVLSPRPVKDYYPATRDECYTGLAGYDRKHFDRMPSFHGDAQFGIAIRARAANRTWPFITLREPPHPWPGTPMLGAMVGYYEPEWEERTAWEELLDLVFWEAAVFVEDEPTWPGWNRTPSAVLRRARALVRERRSVSRREGSPG